MEKRKKKEIEKCINLVLNGIRCGFKRSVRLLVKSGVNINRRYGPKMLSALDVCDVEGDESTAEFLIQNGCDPAPCDKDVLKRRYL